jgi:hypothetical protein
LDGIFAEQPDGPPRFVQLPTLASIDVAELLVTIRTQVTTGWADKKPTERLFVSWPGAETR